MRHLRTPLNLVGLTITQTFLGVFAMVAVLLIRELGFSVIHEITFARQYLTCSGELVAIAHHTPAYLMCLALLFQIPQVACFLRVFRRHALRAWSWLFVLAVAEVWFYTFLLVLAEYFVLISKHPG